MRAQTLHALLLLAIVVGLGFALYSFVESVEPSLQNTCTVTSFVSCHAVDSSGRTTTLGIPDYALGIGGFVLLLAVDIPLYRSWRRDLLTGLLVLSGAGLAFSVYLAYVELVLIGALCPICLGAYLSNALVFVCAVKLWWMGRGSSGPTTASDGEVTAAPGADDPSA